MSNRALQRLGQRLRRHPAASAATALAAVVLGITGVQVAGNEDSGSPDAQTAQHSTTSGATGGADATVPQCSQDALPQQAYEVLEDISDGGPFEYPNYDGGHFGNYEGILPAEDSQYYREYTVDTPGLSHRGARRIVTGGMDADDPETWYYTDDHYESFCSISESMVESATY